MKFPRSVLAIAFAVAACAPSPEPSTGPAPGASAGPTLGGPPPPDAAPPAVASAAPAGGDAAAAPVDGTPIVVPVDALYVCVQERSGVVQQTTIELSPGVAELCRKHPEMGPCQYERDGCRRGGGRVYAAGGREITAQTEAEYDKKVMRVRLRSN